MITLTVTKTIKYYSDAQGNKFEVLALYNPNEDNDTWVEYQNTQTNQKYSCRFEAFESRFHPLPE